jgi:hypothetical protein
MDGLAMIAGFALGDLQETERAISLTPIEWIDGRWQPFNVQPHHPKSLRNLAPSQLCWSYNATREALQQRLGDDVFVANAMLIEKEGEVATLAIWGAGVHTACPLVDAIAIQEDGNSPEIIRSLEDVLSVCGPFPEVEVMPYPTRFLLPERLSLAQRNELTNHYPEHPFFSKNSR